jgi:hypothetical protein
MIFHFKRFWVLNNANHTDENFFVNILSVVLWVSFQILSVMGLKPMSCMSYVMHVIDNFHASQLQIIFGHVVHYVPLKSYTIVWLVYRRSEYSVYFTTIVNQSCMILFVRLFSRVPEEWNMIVIRMYFPWNLHAFLKFHIMCYSPHVHNMWSMLIGNGNK